MNKIVSIIFAFMLLLPFVCFSQEKPDEGMDSGIKVKEGKTTFKDEIIYPNATIEKKPPLAAARGYIYGEINQESLISSMSVLSIEYRLAGWIRKVSDGIYRFHLEGDPEKVREAVAKIPSCDNQSKISNVESKSAVPTKYIKGFKIIDSKESQGEQ